MKNVAQVVTYYAWDTSANTYKVGDSANHTLRGMQDTTEFTPAGSPSEVDSTNLKGAYKVSIAATENIGNLMLVGGVSSTANIVLFPARWSNDPIPGIVRSGVATAGGASTITLDANASATSSIYNGCQCAIVAGTGIGQTRMITAYNGGTLVATVNRAWTTNPDSTSVFVLIPGAADVETWLDVLVTAATGGIPDVNTKNFNNQTAQTDANNLPKVDTEDIKGTASAGAAGSVGIDWAHITAPTTAVDLSGTTIKNVDNPIAEVTLVDTLTTYTGNTPQTGDSFARIGATGSGLTSLAPSATALSTAQWTNARAVLLDNLGVLKIKKNAALAAFPFLMVLSADHVTPATGLTVVVQRSINGGAFANSTNTPATEIANGVYKIDLSAADLNGDTIVLKMTSATADQRTIIIATEP